ncbi:carboxylesterase family protein [Streptomyces sp. R28]|uniref:Carboxylesterase family protein n=1 Tax=Streptomyces sp. R28 TaxID=3238628 RepID=A0AB39PRL0_9ACTN
MPKRRSTARAALGAALLVAVMGTSDAVQTSPATAGQHPHSQPARGQHPEARSDTARTRQGRLEGLTADGVTTYQGIPYAAPPVGPRRWQPPAAPPTWTGTRTAVEPGPACAQPEVADSAEDCLYLNVTTPADGTDRRPRGRSWSGYTAGPSARAPGISTTPPGWPGRATSRS